MRTPHCRTSWRYERIRKIYLMEVSDCEISPRTRTGFPNRNGDT
nr:MAG TPA: hypothetical protein [Caudoviricetes sp.]